MNKSILPAIFMCLPLFSHANTITNIDETIQKLIELNQTSLPSPVDRIKPIDISSYTPAQFDISDDTDVSEFFEIKSQTEIKNSKRKYQTHTDEVERRKSTVAKLKSTNAINMGIGQGGNQYLYIVIENNHGSGFYNDDIRIGYDDALVDVCMDSCYMRARFDDDDAQTYTLDYVNPHIYDIPDVLSYIDPKEYAGTSLNDSDYFLLKLHNAKKLVLNFPNWDGNSYTYRFDLKGLDIKSLGEK